MSLSILNLIIYHFCIFFIDCYVLIPLKIDDNEKFPKILSSGNLDENNLSLILFTNIYLGEPKQNVTFIISPDEYNFYMVTNKNNTIDNNSNFYDFRKSKTNNLDIDEKNINTNLVFMSERFYFQNNNQGYIDEKAVDNINLVLYFQKPRFLRFSSFCSDINSYIIFGLKLSEGFDTMEYSLNLIRQLKRKNITNNYKWFIDYNINKNNEENIGHNFINDIKMIIGVEPHELYPNLYKEKNLKLINAKSQNGYVNWGLYFNKICYYQRNDIKDKIIFELNNNANINNTNLEEYLLADIKHNFIFINSPQLFFDYINQNFFNKLFDKKKCFKKGIKYSYIYCENNKEIEEYIQNNFGVIHFINQELNYEFMLGYQDLFIKSNNKILFLIISQKNFKKWILGIPFLKKYFLTYDYDNKVIGFYKQNYKRYIKRKGHLANIFIKIIFIILLILVCANLGFLIGKYFYGYNRKKRMNELQENYLYEFTNNKNKINNKKNIFENTNKEKLISMEMEKL